MPRSFWLRSSVILGAVAGWGASASAQSIEDTLAKAYTQSTQLGGQRAQQRATDELVPQALSNWRPTVTANANATRTYTGYGPSGYNHLNLGTSGGGNVAGAGYDTSKTVGIQVVQNIYRGGRTEAQTNQATNTVKSGQAQLSATEESVLLAAAQSYLDVVRDQSTVDLNANNEQVLKRQLDAEQDRFRVGEVTRTDVALAEASYQNAIAQYQTAVGTLETDRATFQRVVGQAPGKLVQPIFHYPLPPSLEDAVAQAETSNPSVTAAAFTERAARDNVDLNEGARLPTVQIVGTYSRLYPGTNAESSLDSEGATYGGLGRVNHVDSGSIEALVTWPLYTGGLTSSQVRQAKQTANQGLIALEDAKRVARQSAISAWQQLAASRANVVALTSAVNAAQIGAEGTRQQALVGTATVLDSLTAEQNLLQAQVNLVGAQHDALLYSFELLSAVGQMTARELALPVAIYDPQVNQDRVGDKWFGTGIE
jgi:outer membrane protein/adhesin transport system outer membrane protein